MRVAAIYDVHANLPALEAVLDEIRHAGVDQIVVGGDVLPGPMPHETLTCLLSLSIPVQFIYGNGDVAVLEQMRGREPAGVPEQYRPVVRWNAQQLDSEHEGLLASWPMTTLVEIDGLGRVRFCHATPRNANECFTRLTSEAKLLPVFAEAGAAVVVCGHTHMQFDRMVGNVRVVNAGSVGIPFGEPGAHWLLLGPDVQMQRTRYDFKQAADRIRNTQYPQVEEFVTKAVLQPTSEAQMLDVFGRAELK